MSMDYTFYRKQDYMRPVHESLMPPSESYVCIPPALVIRMPRAGTTEFDLWTLGFDQGVGWRTGEFEYDVVRNMKPTGEYACRIEYRSGKLRIFGHEGWRTWSERAARFI